MMGILQVSNNDTMTAVGLRKSTGETITTKRNVVYKYSKVVHDIT